MKKLLLLVLLTSMFGTAHATRSRMNSLGQDPNLGSFYLMDNRNFFRNPANAAKMRNFMVAELATAYDETEADIETVDGNLEGGYFGEFSSDMAFGVYLGKRNVILDAAANGANPTPTYLTSGDANPFNLFVAGGSDLKWGINLGFAMTENEISAANTQKYNSYGLSVGIETSGGLQVYASYQSATTEGANNPSPTGFVNSKVEASPYIVGIIYALNPETTIYGQYTGGDIDNPAGDEKNSSYIVGIGRIYELSPTARFNFDLSYSSVEIDPAGPQKTEKTGLPLTIGLEADAAEWLILRASVRQNFILGDWTTTNATGVETKTQTNLTGTKVALGGTLHFGKLKIDGNLGGFGGGSNSSLFDATGFFVNAAATYMF